MEKQFWFFIDPYVHLVVKNKTVLLYNSYTGKFLEYKNKPSILKIARRLILPKNLNIIRLNESDLANPEIRLFVEEVRSLFMGDTIDVSLSDGKPVLLKEFSKVQRDIDILKSEDERSPGENLMEYLSEVSLYINNQCTRRCDFCNTAYKQFLCCTTQGKRSNELKVAQIQSLLEELKHSLPITFNILGGNIFTHSHFEDICNLLNSMQVSSNYHVNYLNIPGNQHLYKFLGGNYSKIKIHVAFPLDHKKFNSTLASMNSYQVDISLVFCIRSAWDFENARKLLSSLEIPDYEFTVLYDGENLDFFKDNVFIHRSDIEENHPSMEDIYSRGILNSHQFGRITILSSGRVYSNVNFPALGVLGYDSIYEILYRELDRKRNWFRIRSNISPCKGCVFNRLCPPITNYSYAIRRNDLCNIWED